jgi:hypothetical protein
MICATHALIGAALGRLLKRPAAAFAAGVGSHVVADLMPHRDFTAAVEVPLVAAALTAIALTQGAGSAEFWGAIGAALPDLENVQCTLPGDDGRRCFPTHRNGVHGRPREEVISQIAVAAVCLCVLACNDRKPAR